MIGNCGVSVVRGGGGGVGARAEASEGGERGQ